MTHGENTRTAVTRIEIVAVASLALLLTGLALPAIQKVRAAEARLTCSDHLKTTGMGLLGYEGVHRQLPPASVGAEGARRGWATFVLPHAGQRELADQYRADTDWYQAANKTVVTTSVAAFACPASPVRTLSGSTSGIEWKGAPGDYSANIGLDAVAITGMGLPLNFDRAGPFRGSRRLVEITDGLSSTILLSEQAGRPQAWRKGKRVHPDLDAEEGVWASGRNSIDARGHDEEGIAYPGPCAINCTNSRGVYSFHKGFANVCFADGSVRGLREGLDVWVYYSLLTIRGGDILSPKDYEAD